MRTRRNRCGLDERGRDGGGGQRNPDAGRELDKRGDPEQPLLKLTVGIVRASIASRERCHEDAPSNPT